MMFIVSSSANFAKKAESGKHFSIIFIIFVAIQKPLDMASRKDLKKTISRIIDELIAECMIRSQFVPGTDNEAAGAIVGELIGIDADFISRISHTEPNDAKKYYRALYNDFDNKMEEILKKIEALSPKKG